VRVTHCLVKCVSSRDMKMDMRALRMLKSCGNVVEVVVSARAYFEAATVLQVPPKLGNITVHTTQKTTCLAIQYTD